VKIYLLSIDHERFFFYSDPADAPSDWDDGDDSTEAPPSGVRGWIRSKFRKFKSEWKQPHSGAMRWVRRSWDWLHSWGHPDEAMLARLWRARAIHLQHPASRPGFEVRELWEGYLARQWRRHLVWLILNGTIAPPAIAILWILPGPNLIGYWFAYRAIHHLLVVWGIRRVRLEKIPTELWPSPALNELIERNGDGKATHPAIGGKAEMLDDHVAFHESSGGK
jgi:Mitochondrial K+-H+ exchange-related